MASSARQEHITQLGPAFGEVYWLIWNASANARLAYDELICLFGEDADPTVMASLSPAFTSDIFRIFTQSLMLHISRLTDPPTTGRGANENVTVAAIPQHITDASLRTEIEALVAQAVADAEFARRLRNKHIAHADILAQRQSHHMDILTDVLPKSETAIQSIHAVVAKVSSELLGVGLAATIVYSPRGGEFVARLKMLHKIVQFVDARINTTTDSYDEYIAAFRELFDGNAVLTLAETALDMKDAAQWWRPDISDAD